MNPWDLVTYFGSAALGLSAVVIFLFFLRDARKIIRGGSGDDDES